MKNKIIEDIKSAMKSQDKVALAVVILEKYLPEQLTEEEVTDIINNVFSKVNPTSSSDMGKIMGALTPLVKGKADMGIVSKIVKEKLSNL